MDTHLINQKSHDEWSEKLFRQQKRELAILNAIVQTVSSSINLQETLETALDIILNIVDSSTGWICLMDENKGCSAFVGYKGICFKGGDHSVPPCLVQCVCSRVRKTGDMVIIRKLHPGCPLVDNTLDLELQQGIVGHVSIPLTTKARIVGQLNVAFSDQKQIEQIDLDLLKTIAPQLAVAVENARLWAEVQEKENLRKEMLKRVVIAQEEERRRISRELHDEFGQELTSLLVRLQVLGKMNSTAQSQAIIDGIEKSTSKMLSSIHDLALELRPTILDDLGLVPALTQFIKNCPGYLGLQVEFEVVGFETHRLSREIETTLYRIIQEALTNVARHAGVKKASVFLKLDQKSVVAMIEDYGVGFKISDVKNGLIHNNRLGLYGMEERISLVGGDLTIISTPSEGTVIHVEIPVE